MHRRYTDRSRYETGQRCLRSRFWEYEYQAPDGRRGIVSARKPLPLAVGGAVHEGLAVLLLESQSAMYAHPTIPHLPDSLWRTIEEAAVKAALADLASYRASGLALDATESAALAPKASGTASVTAIDDFDAQLAAQAQELGMDLNDPALAALRTRDARSGAAAFDDYLWQEQSALVEGMVRAYARRRLRPLLDEYEVLEVEREGQWLLHEGLMPMSMYESVKPSDHSQVLQLWFMSRPDALLRSRADNSLYLQSFKTAATWDVRKARDAEHDMQGLSEGVEVERRLGEWWRLLHNRIMPQEGNPPGDAPSQAMYGYLSSLPAPPRILGIRMEYLLKSDRWKDKDLSARFGLDVRSQRSVLIRAYQSTKGEPALNAEWDYVREDGTAGKLAWQNWKSRPVWECGLTVRQWIDRLDASEVAMSAYDSTTGLEPRELGWKSEAQATGFLTGHPLDAAFVPPIVVYRSDDSLLDLVEQMEYQERRIAEGVAAVDATGDDEGARRSALNQHFPMTRRACEYPSSCAFLGMCFGGEDLRRDPIGSGIYQIRVPNHPQEAQHDPVK